MESQTKETKKAAMPSSKGESVDPDHVVHDGAVAASIWPRRSSSGYAYFDYSLSRSWKSMSTENTGYSKIFVENKNVELVSVIEQASAWIAARREEIVEDQTRAVAIAA